MSLIPKKAKNKPEETKTDEELLQKMNMLNELDDMKIPIEKEEQARALSIEKLTQGDSETIKILTELNTKETAGILRMRAIEDIIEQEINLGIIDEDKKIHTILDFFPDEYLRYKISKNRKGRLEIVEIAKSRSEEFGNRLQSMKQGLMGR